VWRAENATCDATKAPLVTARRCTVPMAVLTSATYGYSYSYQTGGEVVRVRVKAANSYGYGALSPVSDAAGAAIRAVPG